MTRRPTNTLWKATSTWVLALAALGSVGIAEAKVSRDALEKEGLSRTPLARTTTRSTSGPRTHTGTPGTLVANPANAQGWTIGNFETNGAGELGSAPTASGTDADFYGPGPGTPPAGTGSFQQVIGTDGDDGTRILSSAYNGVLLSDLTALGYSTYVSQHVDGQATYLQLRVDFDDDGDYDDRLFFEPVYQTGAYSGDLVPDQGLVTLNTWQSWDALAGGWWSENDSAGGPPLHTLANYIIDHPGARLITDTPAIRIQAGFGAGAWDNFIGYFDGFLINKHYYDFEGPAFRVHNIDTGRHYPALQDAIADALTVDGNRIVVDAGVFPGGVTLNKRLTIRGAQSGNSACGRVTGAPDSTTESILTGPAPGPTLLTLVTGSAGSTIEGFSFIGGTRGLESSTGPIHGVSILANHFAGFTGGAIFLNDPGTDVNVTANNLNASSKTANGGTFHLDTDLFDGFHFTNNCVLDAPTGAGFTVDGNNNVRPSVARTPLIANNQVRGQATNVGLNLGVRAFNGGTIRENTITNNRFDGLQGGVRNSLITRNRFADNGRWGLALTSFGNSVADSARGAHHDSVTWNTFAGNDSAGLFISATMYPGHAGSVHSNYNDFVGNGDTGSGWGAVHRGGETLDVGCNWWGHIDGPDYPPANPNPPGDAIFAPVAAFAPWLDGSIAGNPSCNQFPPVNTTTELSSDVNPSTCAQKVNLIATVSPNTASGTVEFFDGGASIGTAPVISGTATLSTTTLPAGHRSLTASYSGDADHNPSASSKYVQNVHCTPTSTTTVVATPCDSAGWFRLNVAGGGTVDITGTYPHVTGSLEFGAVDASSKADFGRPNGNANLLTTLSALAAELYRSSSSTGPAHIVPAIRLFVDNGQATNRYSYLVWEAVYNGYPSFPLDTWTPVDLFKGVFWQRAWKTPGPNRSIDLYRPLSDWLQPGTVTDGDGDVSNEVGPNARVLEYEIGIGSGVPGTFAGAADNFRIGFAAVDTVFDFEARIVTSIALTAPPASTCGEKVVLSADLSPPVFPAALEFFDGATSLGVVPVDANGHAELSVTGLAAGDHTFTASYAGSSPDPCATASVSNPVAHRVNTIATTTALAVDPPKSFYGGSPTLKATVTPAAATGTVEFFEVTGAKSGLFADPTPNNPHYFDLRPVTIGVRFYADVAGVVNAIRFYKDANNSGPHTVELWTAAGTLLASAPSLTETASGWQTVPLPGPVPIQASTHYIAAYHTVSGYPQDQNVFTTQLDSPPLHAPAEAPGQPNGVYVYAPAGTFPTNGINASNYFVDVAFAPATSLGSAPLAGGEATLPVSGLAVGAHTFVAAYGGDACHQASSSPKTPHEVNLATTSILLTSDNNPSEYGEKVIFTATITPSTASGTIAFYDGAVLLKSSPIVGGEATTSISDLTIGHHSITAVYDGDVNHQGTTSNKVDQVVDSISTATVVTSAPEPSSCGQKVTYTATVSPNTATGTVEFFDGGNSIGTAVVVAGVATLSVPNVMGPDHSVTATYSGDATHAGSTSAKHTHHVLRDPTTTTLEASSGAVKVGSKVTLRASVTPNTATGNVDFLEEGGGSVGMAAVVNGVAELSLTTLTPGYHVFKANYLGDGCYTSSFSDTAGQMVNPDMPPEVTVIYPNGGEVLIVGSTVILRWEARDDNLLEFVDLKLSRNGPGGPWEDIVLDTPNDSMHTWVVTAPETNTDLNPVFSAYFRVDATDGALQTTSDISNAGFAIHDKTVPTVMSLFQADPVSAGIELRWQFSGAPDVQVAVERGAAANGPWATIEPEVRIEDGVSVAIDRTAVGGRTYWYRLRALLGEGAPSVFGPLAVTAGAPVVEFALSRMAPNPTAGWTRVEFTVPREAAITLRVVDVQGRQVATLAEGVHRPGRYQATWNGEGDRGAVPVGLYFVQLEAAGKRYVKRLTVAR